MADPLRRRVRARALAGLSGAARVLPASLVRAGLDGLASAARFSRYERTTLANLELALGSETSAAERRRIARGVRRHNARLAAEWLRLAKSGAPGTPTASRGAWIDDAVRLDPSIARLEAELARGRGALIVTAHLGNWELLCARLARMGLRGAVVGYRKQRDPSAAWLEAMRATYGVETLSQQAGPRAVLEVLRAGGVVGLVADLEARRLSGTFAPFFGRPTLTMTAPAALARVQRVPLVPVRCVAGGPGEPYLLAVDEPLELDPGLERRAATLELTARLNAVFERWIRAAPEQWAWHQPRWRVQPEDPRPAARNAVRRSPAAAGEAGSLPEVQERLGKA